MTLHAKMAMSDLQRYPWKLCLINYELEIIVYETLNCLFSFAGSLQKWLAHSLLIRNNRVNHRNKHFSIRKSGIAILKGHFILSLQSFLLSMSLRPFPLTIDRDTDFKKMGEYISYSFIYFGNTNTTNGIRLCACLPLPSFK